MEHINLVETFSEFKEFKNIDRETMMHIIEDIFRHIDHMQSSLEALRVVRLFSTIVNSVQ